VTLNETLLAVSSFIAIVTAIVSLYNNARGKKEISVKVENVKMQIESTLQSIAQNATRDSAEMYEKLQAIRIDSNSIEIKLNNEIKARRRDRENCNNKIMALETAMRKLISGAWVLYKQLVDAEIIPKYKPPKSFDMQRKNKYDEIDN